MQKLGDVPVHVQEQEQDAVTVQEVGKSSSSQDEDATDPYFVQNDYAQSKDEEANIVDYTKDDIWFNGYVDDNTVDPNAEEDNDGDVTGEDRATLTGPNTSSDEDEALVEARRKRKRMPKGLDCRPEIDMDKPIFTLGLRFPTAALFRKVMRRYSVN